MTIYDPLSTDTVQDAARRHAPPHVAALADARLRARQALSALQAIDCHALSADRFTELSRCAASLSDVAFELGRIEAAAAKGQR